MADRISTNEPDSNNLSKKLIQACKLCYEKYSLKTVERIPRFLQCNHVFCTECLQKLNHLQGEAVECPTCSVVTILPNKGIDYLPIDGTILTVQLKGAKSYQSCQFCIKKTYPPKSATLHCVDCKNVYCGSCSDEIHTMYDNQNHVIRLANSFDDMKLHNSISQQKRTTSKTLEEKTNKKICSGSSICNKHQQYLSMYCQKEKVRCCVQCRLSEKHRAHDCDMVKTNDDSERNVLIDWHLTLEKELERYNKIRSEVQFAMEHLKKNTISTKENVRKVFWELRTLIDKVEKDLLQELNDFSNTKLNRLRHQFSTMIERGGDAKAVVEQCEDSLDCDFFEMLVRKKQLESKIMKSMEELAEQNGPCESANLFVQFPKQEVLFSQLRGCSYIVRPPAPPIDFECSLDSNFYVSLQWNAPRKMQYTYPVTLFHVYATIGSDDEFVALQKTSQRSFLISPSHPMLSGKEMIQFRVTCVNIIGESEPCFPLCIRLIHLREHQPANQ